MKRSIVGAVACAVALLFPARARAQENETAPRPRKNGFALGLDIHRYQDDAGGSILLSSPIFEENFRFVARGGGSTFPHGLAGDGTTARETLYHAMLLLEATPPFFKDPIRPYGFLGALALFTPPSLTTTPTSFGFLAGIGVEARFTYPSGGERPVTFFFEVGGIDAGATADKLPSHERLVSGFLISGGVRIYF